MARWRTQTEHWLAAERDGQDETAETAFQQLFEVLPGVEASPSFASRAAEAAWAARLRRRRMAGLAAAAAAVLIPGTAGLTLYALFDVGTAWLLATTAALASSAMLSLLGAGVTLAGWWSATAGAGTTIVAAMANPYGVGALVAIEAVAAAALLMLHRLLRSEVELRGPRAFCF